MPSFTSFDSKGYVIQDIPHCFLPLGSYTREDISGIHRTWVHIRVRIHRTLSSYTREDINFFYTDVKPFTSEYRLVLTALTFSDVNPAWLKRYRRNK
jgi:hypothetical protein